MKKILVLFSFLFSSVFLWSANLVPYSGKVAIREVNYSGTAEFTFSLHDGNGTTYWHNGSQPGETIDVPVQNGRYTVLLGGQGMNPLSPTLFLDYDPLYLKVEFDNNDNVGLRHLAPDQLITATPRALAAEWAKLAQGVPSGAITRAMLTAEVQADLNRTISKSMLGSDVLADLNATPQAGSITGSMLAPSLLSDLNTSIGVGSISRVKMDPNLVRYFIPEISNNPASVQILQGAGTTLSVQANGKYLSYQWQRDGIALTGETNASLVLSDANASVDDANYSVVIANDWGSVSSSVVSVSVSVWGGTHTADLNATVQMQMLWVESGTFTMGSPTSESGRDIYNLLLPEQALIAQEINLQQALIAQEINLPQALIAQEINLEHEPFSILSPQPTSESGQSTTTDHEAEHNVTLSKGFYLGKYEVTQAQYEAVMTGNGSLSATPSHSPNNPNRPVENVSWDDIQIFLSRLNAQQSANIPAGWYYVLPTEAEWEYACRAGTTTAYSWGDTIASSNANYEGNIGQTTSVGEYVANPWGFFDMHGNVWEWTADRYAEYSSGVQTDPTGPAWDSITGSSRVIRGGSWLFPGPFLRSALRYGYSPSGRSSYFGFRVGLKQQWVRD